ncbi:MAG: hypothetical protein WHX60_12355 [Armatimonadota bacterium]
MNELASKVWLPFTKRYVWGFAQGIQIAIAPDEVEEGGHSPRGLFRIGYPILDNGKRIGLVNFIAVEPIVQGRRGFSELEVSQTDGKPGKRFWCLKKDEPSSEAEPGELSKRNSVEFLKVRFLVERFENGAEVVVTATFRSDRPDEVCLTAEPTPNSAPLDQCVLTATMGNYIRARQLWLKDTVVHSRDLFGNYQGEHFAPDTYFPLQRLPLNRAGDIVVCLTTDEADPGKEPADPRAPWWRYRGSFPVTQYWRKPKGTWNQDLQVRVNARRVYWASQVEIPHGIAYENFDLVERFHSNSPFCFGITRKPPPALAILNYKR